MGSCGICGKKSIIISSHLGVCGQCIKDHPDKAKAITNLAHARVRRRMGLPTRPPKESSSTKCNNCPNNCSPSEGQLGFCGLFKNVDGSMAGELAPGEGLVSFYPDPHPTNCVAAWCCAGGSGAGYPLYSHAKGPEIGWSNAAVFLGSCTFHCLFCQNHDSWTSMIASKSPRMGDTDLANSILDNPRYSCLCWFGGCPSSQMEFVLSVSRKVYDGKGDRILRICLETNGNISPRFLKPISELSLKSGGGIKFDLKFASPQLQEAICGVGNDQVLRNFHSLGPLNAERRDPPFLRASTLMVPGYVDPGEVGMLARIIAEVDPSIPYSLLAFHPHYIMSDLPRCSAKYVEDCRREALSAGLKRVRIGNPFLVS